TRFSERQADSRRRHPVASRASLRALWDRPPPAPLGGTSRRSATAPVSKTGEPLIGAALCLGGSTPPSLRPTRASRRVRAPSCEVAKHDRAHQEKQQRNALYALRFRQRRCTRC